MNGEHSSASEARTEENMVGSVDFSGLQKAADDACATIDRLREQRDEAKAGWDENSWRCQVLLDALTRIEKLPVERTGHSMMRAREIAREAIAWVPPPEENT